MGRPVTTGSWGAWIIGERNLHTLILILGCTILVSQKKNVFLSCSDWFASQVAQLHRLLAMMDVALEAAAETTENVFAKSQVEIDLTILV